MRRSIRHAASLAAPVAAAAIFSTAAFAHPGLPGHSHDGLVSPENLLAMVAGALAASLTVWALSRRRSRGI